MITIQAAPLPSNFRGTPQQLLDAFLDRVEILSDVATFVISDEEPETNQGPWFKNGTQLWVWDEDFEGGSYVPLDVSASITDQIWVGDDSVTPDVAKYSLWLKLGEDDTVVGLFYYFGAEVGWVQQVLGNGSVTAAMLVTILDLSAKTLTLPAGCVTYTSLKQAILGDVPSGAEVASSDLLLFGDASNANALATCTVVEALAAAQTVRRFRSANTTLAAGSFIDEAHELGATPTHVFGYLVCINNDVGGYVAGDVIDIHSIGNSSDERGGFKCGFNADDVWMTWVGPGYLDTPGRTPGTYVSLTAANWKGYVVAEL